MKAHLIFPTKSPTTEGQVNWDGCEYSKCGRTDKGVSAFGQVIGIRVRSNRPVAKDMTPTVSGNEGIALQGQLETASPPLGPVSDGFKKLPPHDSLLNEQPSFHHIDDELPYVQVLNRLLPPNIRILAWGPTPPIDFSARFSCRERRYRYFFTQPAFNPTPRAEPVLPLLENSGNSTAARREGWLDVKAMKAAAKRFEGLHDFRNFCKVDASKQIDNFKRRIFHAEIREVDPSSEPAAYVSGSQFSEYSQSSLSNGRVHEQGAGSDSLTPKLYVFILHGSAFLWHQVRHMIAILFLVGQGLESPEIVSRLLDVAQFPQRPFYEMAEDAPLVLWDCIFPREGSDSREDALEWIYVGDQKAPEISKPVKGNGKFGLGGVVDDMWKVWRQRKIDEVLAGMLLNVVVGQGKGSEVASLGRLEQQREVGKSVSGSTYYGGDSARLTGRYVPLMERPRMESVESVNSKYAIRKGFEQGKDQRELGWRQVKLPSMEDEHEGVVD